MPAISELLLTVRRVASRVSFVRQTHNVTVTQTLQRTAHNLSLRRGVGTVWKVERQATAPYIQKNI